MKFVWNSTIQNMTLEEIWGTKNNWIKKTKATLIKYIKTPIFADIEDDDSNEERVVLVYGMPQVGKTELILFLLGVKEEKRSLVYKTLRGSSLKGNSSTSSAIIYKQSPNNQYGVCTQNGFLSGGLNVKFFNNEEEVPKYIDELRATVELGKKNTDVIYIYIPNNYCTSESKEYCNLNILDLPGIKSSNKREMEYVNEVVNRYVAMATVILVVCNASKIQLLETLEIPGVPYWRTLGHKVFVVLTYSYSINNNLEKYLNQKECKSLADFVTSIFEKELRKVYIEWYAKDQELKDEETDNLFSKLEVYPIELGESFRMLHKNYSESNDFMKIDICSIIKEAVDDMGNRIRASIQEKSNEDNLLFIPTMIRRLEDYRNIEKKNTEERLSELKIELEKLNVNIQNMEEVYLDKKSNLAVLAECKERLKNTKREIIEEDGFESSLQKIFAKVSSKIRKNKCGNLLSEVMNIFENNIDENFKNIKKVLCNSTHFSDMKIKVDSSIAKLSELIETAIENIEIEFEKQKEWYLKCVFSELQHKYFNEHKILGASKEECIEFTRNEWKDLRDNFLQTYVSKIKDKVKTDIDLMEKNSNIKCEIADYVLNKIKTDKENVLIEINSSEKQIEFTNIIIQDDQKILEDTFEIADQCYKQEMSKILNQINTTLDSETRMSLFLVAVAIEKDYERLIGKNAEVMKDD